MRYNTIGDRYSTFINDTSKTNNSTQKYSFPKLFTSPNYSRISNYKKLNPYSVNKRLLKSNEVNIQKTFRGRSIARNNIKLVKILNFEDEVNEIISNDAEIQKKKEKIDKNNKIKMLRLGLLKKKENNDSFNFTEKSEAENIVEKEKENEEDLEKINNENREKERKLEKKFKEELTNMENIKAECQKINQRINNIDEKIEEEKMELNILVNYAEEFDKKYQREVAENINDKNININNEEENVAIKDSKEGSESNRKKNKHFEKLNKLIIYKQQREDKKKFLKENIRENEKLKQELEKELDEKRIKCNEYKKGVYNLRKNLISSYHLKLYEGIDYRNEGLISIIKDIWNLGVNVDTNFMPTYLDDLSIQFLLQKAKQSIEIAKIRKVISDNENEYSSLLKEWRLNDMEINNILNKRSSLGFFSRNNEGKDSINDTELFKTKVSDISISYLNPYPKTKEFMIDYKKKHNTLFQNEIPESEVRHMKFESFTIPAKVLEKTKKIEKLKYLLGMKIEQNKQNDKNEVERIIKEYIKNDYKKRFKVIVEILFGALFGDKKNDMLNYYAKLDKEFKDGNKIIQFHTKYKIKLK